MAANPNGRFQVIQQATALPGCCSICSQPNGPFIDFGISIEFFGAVIFCFSCVKDAGRTAGLVDEKTEPESVDTVIYLPSLKEAIDDLLESHMASARVTSYGVYSLFGSDVPAESSIEDSSGDVDSTAAIDGSNSTDGQVDSDPLFEESAGISSGTSDVGADASIFN